MNIRIPVGLGFGMVTASAFAQPVPYDYSFTPEAGLPSFTLSNAYLFDTEPALAVQFTEEFPLQGTFAPGVEVDGTLTFDSPYGPQLLNFISVFTDSSGNVGVAVSLPTTFANLLIANNTSWDQFNQTYFVPYVALPDEATSVADLESGVGWSALTPAFAAQPVFTSPIFAEFGPQTIVAFDGATLGGAFEYQPAPEPSSLALGGLVIALLSRRSMSARVTRK